MASLAVVSIYPSIPIKESLNKIVMNEDFVPYGIELAEQCIKNTYFSFKGQIYKQSDKPPMESSLSPVTANLYMDYFETEAIKLFSTETQIMDTIRR